MNAGRRRLGTLVERWARAAAGTEPGREFDAVPDGPPFEPDPEVVAELKRLRSRLDRVVGSLVAASDGRLVAHDLPPSVEPAGMAVLTVTHLALSHRLAATAHGGGFHEVVVHGTGGFVAIYAAGWHASLTVLAGPDVNVGRLHLESRPAARAIARRLAASAPQEPAAGRETGGRE
ncbi:roadblock/LC7 domain-containing protein [Actinomadura gamaensis]|uniref:Roadblock/LC7 domain-containing protein n=1 Tax=Actinomadura gamaensis TaxID=1763541 RepID=A0ABV9TTL7_9ACTN